MTAGSEAEVCGLSRIGFSVDSLGVAVGEVRADVNRSADFSETDDVRSTAAGVGVVVGR